MLKVVQISEDEEFYKLKDEWDILLSKSNCNNLFLTWDWLYHWWKIFCQDKNLNILLIRKNGDLIAVAPLFLTNNKMLGIKQIHFLGSNYVGSDYLDFIIQKGSEDEVIPELCNYLNSGNGWHFINLTDIPAHSKSIELIQKYHKDNWLILTNNYTICPYITLPDNYNLFLQSLSSNMRSNIKRKRRIFENDLKGEFVILREKNEVNKSIEELNRLNFYRMRVKNLISPFYDPLFNQFHKVIIPIFFERGWLRLCFLRVKNKYIACLYVYRYGNKYYYYQSGFDLEWEKVSPGVLLFSYCIENAILEGMEEFDFLRGNEDYKYRWTKQERKNLRVKIFNDTFKGKIAYWFYRSKAQIKTIKRIPYCIKRPALL